MSHSVIDQIRDELVTGVERYEVRRRRVRAAGVAAAMAVVVAGGAVALTSGPEHGSKVQVRRDPRPTTTTQPAPPLEPGPLLGLHKLPRAPGPLPVAPVWTGREFLLVGPLDEAGTLAAYAYDVGARRWRSLSHPPVEIGQGGAAAWTGTELVVCCGWAHASVNPSASAVAYNPATDTWRALPNAPVHGYVTSVWTGSAMIVVASDGVASFDPDTETWTRLPRPPVGATFIKSVWTGHDLVVWPAPGSRTVQPGAIYNPVTREWRQIPDPPEDSWPAIPDIAWIDDSLVIVGGLPAASVGSERLVSARYDPSTDTWGSIPDPLPEPDGSEGNLGSQTTLWTGRQLLMHVGALASGLSADGALFAFDATANAWQLIGDTKDTALEPVAVAGDRVLLQRGRDYFLSAPGWTARPESHG